MARRSDDVNISRTQFVVHSFYFALEAARICMVPFLTLFFRHLGLSALQAGAICGLKAVTWSLMAPVWTRISGNCGMKKSVFLLSIFMYASTYLLITLVPPADKNYVIDHCNKSLGNHGNDSGFMLFHPNQGPIDFVPTAPIEVVPEKPLNDDGTESFTPTFVITPNTSKSTQPIKTTTMKLEGGESQVTQSMTTVPLESTTEQTLTTKTTTVLTPTTRFSTTPTTKVMAPPTTKIPTSKSLPETDDPMVLVRKLMRVYHLTRKQLLQLSPAELKVLIDGMSESKKTDETDQPINEERRYGEEDENENYDDGSINKRHRSKRYLSSEIRRSIYDTIEAMRGHVFILVGVVVLFGEVFVAPLKSLADNLWFWFLEGIDASEHYGHQTLISFVAAAVFSMVVTVVIDRTDCLLAFEIDHFMIHFYAFAAILVPVFVLGLFFPSPPRNIKSQKKKHLTWKALCIIVKDKTHILCLFSVFMLGCLRASVLNFLFWVIEDFGTSEITYGFAICISSLSNIPLLILQKSIVRKITVVGVIALSFLALSAQTVYYSFLWSFWAALPIQVLTGFVETGFWIGIKSISSFRTTSPAVDREVMLILENIYHGIGFCSGSIMSGWIAEVFGFSILYQCVSVAALVWGIMFVAVWKLTRPTKNRGIRYTKLNLAGDDEEDDIVSDHGFDEDDWLEVALKDDR